MKTIMTASLGMMMVLSSAALAQNRTPQRPPELAEAERTGIERTRSALVSNPAEVPLEAPVGKVGRSFGPNVMGAIFAPVGIIVAPINEGLRAIDTAIAPINVALRPLTGRIAVPAGEPSVIPAATVPGPRK